MRLKRFDNRLPKVKKYIKTFSIILSICLVAILSLTSYALFKVYDKRQIVDSKVGEFYDKDLSIAILVNGEKMDNFPVKDGGKVFDKIECTNSGEVEWDEINWKLHVTKIIGPTECTISFSDVVVAENAVEKITELAETNTTEMFIDDTEDANIRYMGKNPANYVDLGNGNDPDGNPILWRIIGVMNNVDDGTGKKETRLKVIRDESIGNIAWDAKCTLGYNEETDNCDGYIYSNDWEEASLNKTLNEAFYNRTKTIEANYGMFSQNFSFEWKYLDFTNIGITENMRLLIGNTVFHLGGISESSRVKEYYYEIATAKDWYRIEKSTNKYSGNPATWLGKVGLMYPSDYGYATGGGSTTDKAKCATKALYYWNYMDATDCAYQDWLYDSNNSQWSLSHLSSNSLDVVSITKNGQVDLINNRTTNSNNVYPVLYLKSDVKIMGGEGTKENPYKIGI